MSLKARKEFNMAKRGIAEDGIEGGNKEKEKREEIKLINKKINSIDESTS